MSVYLCSELVLSCVGSGFVTGLIPRPRNIIDVLPTVSEVHNFRSNSEWEKVRQHNPSRVNKLPLCLVNPAQHHDELWGGEDIAPLDAGEWSASSPSRFSSRYRLDRRLGGPQSRSGCCGVKKNLSPLSITIVAK
jgi:hypothetical protein